MGMVRESEEMQREIDEMPTQAGNLQLLSTQINASTDLSVCVRPLCYDVVLGSKTIVSLNNQENAVVIYQAMRADFKGEVYNG